MYIVSLLVGYLWIMLTSQCEITETLAGDNEIEVYYLCEIIESSGCSNGGDLIGEYDTKCDYSPSHNIPYNCSVFQFQQKIVTIEHTKYHRGGKIYKKTANRNPKYDQIITLPNNTSCMYSNYQCYDGKTGTIVIWNVDIALDHWKARRTRCARPSEA
ncbi:hypothetical protein JTB14_017830 [Gonioctena quinquepunctata]|nr:hypothetical protein JTB14_017830 [Gonioctena quinquepunctata]